MTAPSIKEALELKPCPFCGDEAKVERYGDHRASTIYRCTNCGCSLETGEEWGHGQRWNERATLSPPAGERREAIARIIAGPLCDATKGEHSIAVHGNYQFCTQCGETISKRWHGIVDARNKADALLASGLVQDEAGIRADEREKCAKIAESPDIWKQHEGDFEGNCIAAAIRSARDGGDES